MVETRQDGVHMAAALLASGLIHKWLKASYTSSLRICRSGKMVETRQDGVHVAAALVASGLMH
jgi:hypothetical protein